MCKVELMTNYDLVVIGGGPAGTPVAMEYAKLNQEKRILLIDKLGMLGGECLFDGCIPSKIMQISAKYIQRLSSLKEFGVALDDSHYQLVWDTIVQRKEAILLKRSGEAKKRLPKNIDLYKGYAQFIDEKTLSVTSEGAKPQSISFKKCVIATGSKAFIPPFKGNGIAKSWTNEDFFERMELPKDMTIIGDGPIAIEFTQILSTLGVKINLIGRQKSVLKQVEDDASHYILNALKQNKNVNLILNAEVTTIHYNDEFDVIYTQDGHEKSICSQKVMVATGRTANTESLNLDKAGVDFNKQGIQTDGSLQSSCRHIYANGDVVAHFPRFAHTAQYGAHTIAQNLFLEHNLFKVNFDMNSWVLFSEPNIAMAGISEKEALKRGMEVITGVYDYSVDAKSQIEGEDVGFLKYVVNKKNNQIIGISIMTNEANTIAGEAALIVSKNLTLSDLVATIHPHPTLSESFANLAKQMMGEIMQEKLKNPLIKTMLTIERFL